MKQITIDELIPLLKKGWVAMDNNGNWWWYKSKPRVSKRYKSWKAINGQNMKLNSFEKKDIVPFDGDWKDSLIKVERSKKKSADRKDFDDFIEQHGVSPWGFLTEAILKEDFECWKKRRKNDKDTN